MIVGFGHSSPEQDSLLKRTDTFVTLQDLCFQIYQVSSTETAGQSLEMSSRWRRGSRCSLDPPPAVVFSSLYLPTAEFPLLPQSYWRFLLSFSSHSWLRSFSLLSVVSSFHFMLSSSPPALTQTLPKNNPSLHIRPYPFTLITSLFSWTEWTVCDGSGRASHVINMEIMAELCVGQSGLSWRIGCFVRWFPQSGYLTNDSGSNSVCLSFGREVNYSHL